MLATVLAAGGAWQAAYAEPASGVSQTSGTCTGTVLDADGETVIGASVFVEGTSIGTSTDLDGRFSMSGVKPGAKLRITCVGYNTETVVWNGEPLTIVMKSSATDLNEVVVVGYGTQKKVNLTGAVAAVNGDVIQNRPV
ncbi:MAG: carboxypeptidase-like regulatory domain-containing protein, partial [Muribaculaceae bacterium]|nr:carboxypeptidase-like regulatory domain-containing protein [Muribaculaceae bacterium]